VELKNKENVIQNKGKVIQVVGPVVDIRFEPGNVPAILNAVRIVDGQREVWAEISQHMGNSTVRCIALEATDGLKRGLDAYDWIGSCFFCVEIFSIQY
jgi:F-type H+-transporting ATPase subunit beta